MTLEDYEQKLYNAMNNGKTINCKDGIRGKISKIVRFKYTHGIDFIIVTPIHNAEYRAEKVKLGDDWDLSIYDFCDPFYHHQIMK